jgi:hypothetical protein
MRRLTTEVKRAGEPRPRPQHRSIVNAGHLIRAHVDDERRTIERLARVAHVSPDNLVAIVSAMFGPPTFEGLPSYLDYLAAFPAARIASVAHLPARLPSRWSLRTGPFTVDAIAWKLGIGSRKRVYNVLCEHGGHLGPRRTTRAQGHPRRLRILTDQDYGRLRRALGLELEDISRSRRDELLSVRYRRAAPVITTKLNADFREIASRK